MKYTIKDISRNVIIIILIGLTINIETIWYTFFPVGNEYGAAFNRQRAVRGILPLPSTWTTEDNASSSQVWLPPDTTQGAVTHTSKIMIIGEDSLSYEEDNIIRTDKGRKEWLSMEYYYDSTNHWKCFYTGPAGNDRRPVDRREADSILLHWHYFKQ
ncbi:hypothetical protein F0L74_24110 [Chitinophaga agrisoli]|uniref:Uncharacterized protein n=1 Tax=Chitinophaga agrisoli TaxID=2607653 RepID=A0A5B2VI88_9BACT|nr:hypothetical protein [Chitinophaga agrisoli]KAA2239293.1 hypothetical protein F0L74_24110 [Chitinophaga agrisoli]